MFSNVMVMVEMIKILVDIGGFNKDDEIDRYIGGYWWF